MPSTPNILRTCFNVPPQTLAPVFGDVLKISCLSNKLKSTSDFEYVVACGALLSICVCNGLLTPTKCPTSAVDTADVLNLPLRLLVTTAFGVKVPPEIVCNSSIDTVECASLPALSEIATICLVNHLLLQLRLLLLLIILRCPLTLFILYACNSKK